MFIGYLVVGHNFLPWSTNKVTSTKARLLVEETLENNSTELGLYRPATDGLLFFKTWYITSFFLYQLHHFRTIQMLVSRIPKFFLKDILPLLRRYREVPRGIRNHEVPITSGHWFKRGIIAINESGSIDHTLPTSSFGPPQLLKNSWNAMSLHLTSLQHSTSFQDFMTPCCHPRDYEPCHLWHQGLSDGWMRKCKG